jgi:hypothetical protein
MHPENKNAILRLFYGEASQQEARHLRRHLQSCEGCREYLRLLRQMDAAFEQWPDELPAPDTFEKIMANIPQEQPKAIHLRPAFSARPFFNIVFGLLFILLSIYFVQSRLAVQPIWQSLQKLWVFDFLGSFGFVAVLFFAIGSFLTLALAPVLYFDLHRKALRI